MHGGQRQGPTQCFPLNTGPINGKPTAGQEASLKASEGTGTDTAQNPHRHVSGDKPPVMGVLNSSSACASIRSRGIAITYEIGFRNAMFTGVGVHYLF